MQYKQLSMKEGICHLQELKLKRIFLFNNFELDGITFLEPNVHLFQQSLVLAPYAKVWKHYRY
jgi:hypothetical protein